MIQTTIDQAIEESFSKQVKRLNSVRQTCPCCGHVIVSYRMKFRTKLVPALKALAVCPMPIGKLSDLFPGAQGRYVADYFAEARLWGLATKQSAKWTITDEGRAFLSGKSRIPLYRWQRDKGELPSSCVDGPMVAAHELDGWHPGADRKAHAEDSIVPSTTAPQLSLT
jgi:hypothetical protein